MKNLFIVVDGMDGSGKTELIKMLHNYLFSKDKRLKILTTREPSTGPYGQQLRKMLAEEKNPKDNAHRLLELFIKDREDHLRTTVEPFLKEKSGWNVVLCDRYYYSTFAFQQTQGIELEVIRKLNEKFRKPDAAFILDVKPEIALKRVLGRVNVKEKFENLGFMKELQGNFLALKNQLHNENIMIVDSNRPLPKVFDDVRKDMDKLLSGA